ncbi:MAG: hypothetical protein ABIP94_16545 [Planctomycetota bacterium]
MSPETYRLLHVVGVLLLFLGLGGILGSGGREAGKASTLFLAMHGIGLLTMLVAGIGFAHKKEIGWPNWLLAKIACWVLIGALPFLVRGGVLPRSIAILLVVAIGATAAWLARAHPF